jgi:hypothetical protein
MVVMILTLLVAVVHLDHKEETTVMKKVWIIETTFGIGNKGHLMQQVGEPAHKLLR